MLSSSSSLKESPAADLGAELAAFVKQILSDEPTPLDNLPIPASLVPDYFVPPTDQTDLAPEKILMQLMRSPYADVRRAVAHYRDMPATCLLQLTRSNDAEMRRIALERLLKEYAAPATLQALVDSHYEDVQLAALTHPLLPQVSLITLAGMSAFQRTRSAALQCLWKQPLDPQVFERIAASAYPDVLTEVIKQPAVPLPILIELARDSEHEQIRRGILERLAHTNLTSEGLVQLSASRFEDVLLYVCRQPQTPVFTLVNLAAGSSIQAVRTQALQRVAAADASEEILARLANSPYQDVVQIVTGHARVSMSTLLQVTCRNSAEPVRRAALAQITQRGLGAAGLSILANSAYRDVLEVVARHPATPTTCYEQVARNLGASLSRDYMRTEYRTEQEWVDDTEYDAYGYAYSSGGHYEDRQVPVEVLDYDRINQLLTAVPQDLRRALREHSGSLQSDSQVKWAV